MGDFHRELSAPLYLLVSDTFLAVRLISLPGLKGKAF